MSKKYTDNFFKAMEKKYLNKFMYFDVPNIVLSCNCYIDRRIANLKSHYIVYSITYPHAIVACVVCNRQVTVRLEFLTNKKHKIYSKCAII